jgi:hypothetical protein
VVVAKRAAGPFDVKLKPQSSDADPLGSTLARLSIDKQFHGDLEATSKGEMLSAGTQVKGSAGYVAIERVSGTLHGRRGTFVLQHSGTMTQGAPQLVVSVSPTRAPVSWSGSRARCRSTSPTESTRTCSSTRSRRSKPKTAAVPVAIARRRRLRPTFM